jgi:hypothetical protein
MQSWAYIMQDLTNKVLLAILFKLIYTTGNSHAGSGGNNACLGMYHARFEQADVDI